MTPRIVAHVGVIGSGKDYQSDKLVRDHGFVRLDFKDALIDMCSDLVGHDIREYYDAFKRHSVGLPYYDDNSIMRQIAWQDDAEFLRRYPSVMTGRVLLQRLGTDVMRKRDPEYWVKQFKTRAHEIFMEGRSIACADCRFPNEIDAILGGKHAPEIKFCDYKSPRYDPFSSHGSERMAQKLLAMGLRDGEAITLHHFRDMVKNP